MNNKGKHYFLLFIILFFLLLIPKNGETFWGRQNGFITTENLYDVWGLSADFVIAAGENGTVAHYDGISWFLMDSPTSSKLNNIWGSAEDDVFVVGDDGTIIHYNGSEWSLMDSGVTMSLKAVWGTSAADVFAAGVDGVIIHYDGLEWSEMFNAVYEENSIRFSGIGGTSPTNVFAVGNVYKTGGEFLIYHYDGLRWRLVLPGVKGGANSMWVSPDSDIYIVGTATAVDTEIPYAGNSSPIIRYFDGTSLIDYPSHASNQRITSQDWETVSIENAGIYRSDESKNGHIFSNQYYGAYYDIWGGSSKDLITVGNSGSLYTGNAGAVSFYEGTAKTSSMRSFPGDLYGVWGSSPTDVFAVGEEGTILHYDGRAWIAMNGKLTKNELTGVWGSSPENVYAVGNGVILHYDGTTWRSTAGYTFGNLQDVWGSSTTDIFAVGLGGEIWRFNGDQWIEMENPHYTSAHLYGVWGFSESDVFAVGDNGTILHFDGFTWSPVESGTEELLMAVGGSSPTDFFAVGGNNTVLHYNGAGWTSMSIAWWDDLYLNDIWAGSPTDVYVTDSNRGVYHYDGNEWTHVFSTERSGFRALWGRAADDVFGVTSSGTVFHFDGTDWSSLGGRTGTPNDLWVGAESYPITVGYDGHIVHYDGLTKREVSFGDGDPEIGVSLTSAFGTYANYGARFLVEKQAVITEVQTALTQRYGKTNHTYLIRFFSDDNGLPGVQIGDDYIFDAEKIPEWPKWRSYEIGVPRLELPPGSYFAVIHDPDLNRQSEEQGVSFICADDNAAALNVRNGEFDPSWKEIQHDLYMKIVMRSGEVANGYSGWWFHEEESGTGWSVEIEYGKLFGAWYVFSPEGESVWYTFGGPMADDDTFVGDLIQWTGRPPGIGYEPPTGQSVGEVKVQLLSSDRATFLWTLDGQSGRKDIQAFMPHISPGPRDPRSIHGWWYDPAYEGMGWFIEAAGGNIFSAWYNYREDGTSRWYTMGGEFSEEDDVFSGPLLDWSEGQCVGCEYSEPYSTALDEAVIDFECLESEACFSHDGVTYNLERFPLVQ